MQQGVAIIRAARDQPRWLSLSHSSGRNRLFNTCSFGFFPPPSSRLELALLSPLCSVSGCLTWVVMPDPGEPPHILSRSFKRFIFSFSLGLVATLSSQSSTLPIVIVCSSSGALTLIVNRVADPSGISARTLRRNAAIASTAAS
jgi:hypothetical protein